MTGMEQGQEAGYGCGSYPPLFSCCYFLTPLPFIQLAMIFQPGPWIPLRWQNHWIHWFWIVVIVCVKSEPDGMWRRCFGGLQSFLRFSKVPCPTEAPFFLAVYDQVHLAFLPLEGMRYQTERRLEQRMNLLLGSQWMSVLSSLNPECSS